MKKCSKCGEEKPATAEFFYKNPNIGIEILDDLKAFCIKHKISNLSNLKGKLIYHNE